MFRFQGPCFKLVDISLAFRATSRGVLASFGIMDGSGNRALVNLIET
jgi:hypothetical protein